MTSGGWGALGFVLGVFVALFFVIAFDIRLGEFTARAMARLGLSAPSQAGRKAGGDTFRGAIARRLAMGPSIVAVGGGTGLSTLLKGIKGFTRNITAVVAVTDEGGSSGRLRTEWGVLPPGDVRNCMVALAENDNALKRILDFRFDRGELAGHSLGNLLLLAVSELCGDFRVAVEQMNHLLAIRGRVLPVTTEDIILFGQTQDGRRVKGELEISKFGSKLKELWVEPQDAHPVPDVLRAASEADIILLGPGSLFTSVIPNLLLPEFAAKLRDAPAPKVYICNLMTQPDETEGMNVVQHIEWVSAALGAIPDCVIVNNDPIPDDIVEAYSEEGAEPLYLDRRQREAIKDMGCICVEAPTALVIDGIGNRYLRHDPQKLAAIVFRICRHIGVDPFEEGAR